MQSNFPVTVPAPSLTVRMDFWRKLLVVFKNFVLFLLKKLEADATLTRIQQTKGIEGTLVLNHEGNVTSFKMLLRILKYFFKVLQKVLIEQLFGIFFLKF